LSGNKILGLAFLFRLSKSIFSTMNAAWHFDKRSSSLYVARRAYHRIERRLTTVFCKFLVFIAVLQFLVNSYYLESKERIIHHWMKWGRRFVAELCAPKRAQLNNCPHYNAK
jgi:hypothetical protein